MKIIPGLNFVLVLVLCVFVSSVRAEDAKAPDGVARGRYLVKLAGCNDCHTAGYGPSGGKVPEEQWLQGDAVGWRGPWGTTYPINLRRFFANLTLEQWLTFARSAQSRPPMPSYLLHEMEEQDLRDLYQYIRSLPVTGDDAPAYLPPDKEPMGPYFTMVNAPQG